MLDFVLYRNLWQLLMITGFIVLGTCRSHKQMDLLCNCKSEFISHYCSIRQNWRLQNFTLVLLGDYEGMRYFFKSSYLNSHCGELLVLISPQRLCGLLINPIHYGPNPLQFCLNYHQCKPLVTIVVILLIIAIQSHVDTG